MKKKDYQKSFLIVILFMIIFNSCVDNNNDVIVAELKDEWVLINQLRNDTLIYPEYIARFFKAPKLHYPVKLVIKSGKNYEIETCGISCSNVGIFEVSKKNRISFTVQEDSNNVKNEWENQFIEQLRLIEKYEMEDGTLILKSKSIQFRLVKSKNFNLKEIQDNMPHLICVEISC